MKLITSIASYTGLSRKNMETILTDDVKDIITNIIKDNKYALGVDNNLMSELVDMDILCKCEGKYLPNTAIFFEEDINIITDPVLLMSEKMADILQSTATDLLSESPNIRNFIGVVIGMGQGLHVALKSIGCASEWQSKTGKYEKCRVDFNEDCQSYHAFGDDIQNKNVIRGHQYTGVTIGNVTENYNNYLIFAANQSAFDKHRYFIDNINTALTDIFPLLILRHIENVALENAARIVNIEINNKSSVITLNDSKKYQPIIDKISDACNNYYCSNIDNIREILMATTVGRNGAPLKNLMMNFWRYMRKGISIKLYENGFLNDKIPIDSSFTIFYENEIGYF